MRFSKIGIKIYVFLIALFIIPAIPMIANALPAFPGAEGWGSDTIGGRGGTVCKVTSLSDSSSGSCSGSGSTKICSGTLRYCMYLQEPRYVIFRVGGTITLGSGINLKNTSNRNYLTVAGQTAPGGGILIRGPRNTGPGGTTQLNLDIHDAVIRGLRMRDDTKASLALGEFEENTSRNIIVDHNSFSWNTDTILGVWAWWETATFSYNIIAEGLDPTGSGNDSTKGAGFLMGMGVSSGYPPCNGVHHLTAHHNVLIHNDERNFHNNYPIPYFELINNYAYNWGRYGLGVAGPAYIVGNHYEPGSGSSLKNDWYIGGLGGSCSFPSGSVYMAHNINQRRPTDTGDEWLVANGGTSSYRTNTPPYPLSGVTEDTVGTIKSNLLASDGAGAIIPYRDAVDVRIVNDAINGTGSHGGNYKTPEDVGGWPTIASGTAPTDTDGDGMPDVWEQNNGTNPNAVDYNSDLDGDGYTNIEEYINSFFASGPTSAPVPVPNPPTGISIQ